LKRLKIFSDGCSRGNPGQAGIGYLIYDERGEIISERSCKIGIRTNNEAEYIAVIKALEEAIRLGAAEVEVFSDSELLVKQVRGEYAVRSDRLKPLYQKLIDLSQALERFEIKHVRRMENERADKLASLAIASE